MPREVAMIGCLSLDGFENTPSLQVLVVSVCKCIAFLRHMAGPMGIKCRKGCYFSQNWMGKIAPHDLACLACSNFSRKTHWSSPGGLLSHLRGMSVKEITAQCHQCRGSPMADELQKTLGKGLEG